MSEPPTGPWLTWCLEERLFLWPFDLDLRDLRRSGDPSNSVKSPPGRIPSENMTWNNEIEKKNSWIFHNFQKVDQHDGYKSYIYLKTVLEILLWYKKKRLKIKSKKRRRVLGETGLDFILIICEIQLHFFFAWNQFHENFRDVDFTKKRVYAWMSAIVVHTTHINCILFVVCIKFRLIVDFIMSPLRGMYNIKYNK